MAIDHSAPTPLVKGAPGAPRAALYLRVSTGRQAEADLSIPDQRRQTQAYCEAQGWTVVATFTEPGASAMDDQRPVFQQMIEQACSAGRPFDHIVVHSYSRFSRDSLHSELYVRQLKKHGVSLVSITQPVGDDPSLQVLRKIFAIMDEHSSHENAKHVLRSMKENARQGYWNGSKAPYGYRAVEVERKGARVKKRLEIDPVEAETVRLFYRLLLEGHGRSGPLGIKAMCSWLNENGYRTRTGARWGIGPLHDILTRPLYAGRMQFNRTEAKTRQAKPEAEVIEASVPAIIDQGLFERAQAHLKSRNPKVTPPRVTSSPLLLAGIARCATCGGGMTLRTGTSSSRRKIYHYYTCSPAMRLGKTACPGRSIPRDKLDHLVTNKLLDALLTPERVHELLLSLKARREERNASADQRLLTLQREASEAEEKVKRLYAAIAKGIADVDDPLFAAEVTRHRTCAQTAKAALERARSEMAQPIVVDPALVNRFVTMMRENISSGEPAFRKAYIGAIVDGVEVDDAQIRIIGRKDQLEQAVLASTAIGGNVRGFVRKWRTRHDSNV